MADTHPLDAWWAAHAHPQHVPLTPDGTTDTHL